MVTSEQTLTKGFLCSAVVLNILTDTVVHTLHVSSYSPDVILGSLNFLADAIALHA